jgi:hypothetical protein
MIQINVKSLKRTIRWRVFIVHTVSHDEAARAEEEE